MAKDEQLSHGRPREGEALGTWAQMYGIRVYNYALIDIAHGRLEAERSGDSELERRIGYAIQDAYERGFRRGAETLEMKLGA